MPRREVPTPAVDKVEKTICSYLEVSVVNMFKDQGGRPGLGVEGKKQKVMLKNLSQFPLPNTTQVFKIAIALM